MGKLTIDMIIKWKRLSGTLKTVKKQEMELRKEIAQEVLQGKIGTVSMMVGDDKVKAQQSNRYKVDNEALLAIWPNLSDEEQASIKFTPEVIVSNYKKLTSKKLLDSVITTVPNAPTLEVK